MVYRENPSPRTWCASWRIIKDDGSISITSSFSSVICCRFTAASTTLVWAWEKLPGHQRNEPLDCRNYANAGLRIINPDMDAIERRLKGATLPPKDAAAPVPQQPRRTKRIRTQTNDDW